MVLSLVLILNLRYLLLELLANLSPDGVLQVPDFHGEVHHLILQVTYDGLVLLHTVQNKNHSESKLMMKLCIMRTYMYSGCGGGSRKNWVYMCHVTQVTRQVSVLGLIA